MCREIVTVLWDAFGTGQYIMRAKIGAFECTTPWFSTSFNTLRTGDADLRFYVTTVQDG